MPTIETLAAQARRLDLIEEQDFAFQTYTNRTTNQEIHVLELTPEGKQKRQQIIEKLFPQNATEYAVPFGNTFDIHTLTKGSILGIDGLLALSIIRRRTGGYLCRFIDDFSALEAEKYMARVLSVDPEKGTVRVVFNHWPGEYHTYEYVLEKPNLTSVNEPISIGPECVIDFQILKDGRAHENSVKWMKNLIKRNLNGFIER